MNDRKCTRIIIHSDHAITWCFINVRYFTSFKQTMVDSFSYIILNFWTKVKMIEQYETFVPFDDSFLKTAHGFFWEKYLTYLFNIILSIIHLINVVVRCHMVYTSSLNDSCNQSLSN